LVYRCSERYSTDALHLTFSVMLVNNNRLGAISLQPGYVTKADCIMLELWLTQV